jgi:hypothetical protein
MPSVYDVKMTSGALKLARRFDRGPEGLLFPPVGGGGTRIGQRGPSTKGRKSLTWSGKSRRSMRYEFGALPWEMLGRRPVMITLTYPGDWQLWVTDARELHKHREAFRSRWERKWGSVMGVWVTEFQTRGAPHLHLYLALPDAVSEQDYRAMQKRTMNRKRAERDLGRWEARRQMRAVTGEFGLWLRDAWSRIVGSELPAHHTRGVDVATFFFSDRAERQSERARVADYLWRESGKWGQKNPPEGFGGLRFYGRWGGKDGFRPVVTEASLDERTGIELRRVMVRWQQQKMRQAAERTGRTYRKGAGGTRGRDGLTVFDIDGRRHGPRLIEWAFRLAAQKAEASDGQEPVVFVRGAGRQWLRAWSEFEVDLNAPPDPEDGVEPYDQEGEALDAYEAHLDAIAEQEAAVDAAFYAWQEQRERHAARDRQREQNRGLRPRRK